MNGEANYNHRETTTCEPRATVRTAKRGNLDAASPSSVVGEHIVQLLTSLMMELVSLVQLSGPAMEHHSSRPLGLFLLVSAPLWENGALQRDFFFFFLSG